MHSKCTCIYSDGSEGYSNAGRRLIAMMDNVPEDDINESQQDNAKGNTVSMSKWKDVMIVVSVIGGVTLILIITFIAVKCCRLKDETLLTEHNIERLSFSLSEEVNSPLLDQLQTKH